MGIRAGMADRTRVGLAEAWVAAEWAAEDVRGMVGRKVARRAIRPKEALLKKRNATRN